MRFFYRAYRAVYLRVFFGLLCLETRRRWRRYQKQRAARMEAPK